MPARGADTRGARRPGAARSASGRRGRSPGPAAPILADDPRPHSPSLSPFLPLGSWSQSLTWVPSSCGTEAGSDRRRPEMGTQGAPAPQPAAEKASTCSLERPHAEEPHRHPSCTHQPHLGCSDLRVSLGSPTCKAPHFCPRAAQRSSWSVLPGLGSGQPTPTWWPPPAAQVHTRQEIQEPRPQLQ